VIDVLREHLGPSFLEYREGWELQRRIHADVVAGRRPATMVLCEHRPVFTAGKRTAADERPDDGTPVIDVDRGGKLTWHGPGQLTGYPIVRLEEGPKGTDVVAFVRDLESLLIDVAAAFGVEGERVEGRSGVWVRTAFSHDKIGAIGLRVQDGVTMHGFALNCSNALEPYAHFVPCGIRDAGVTTLSALTGRRIDPVEAADLVTERFDRFVRYQGRAVAVAA
jgi:lipoyl(octanoyl) transferase